MKKLLSFLLVMVISVTAIVALVPPVKAEATESEFEQKNILQIWADSSDSYISGKWYSTTFDGTNIQSGGCGIVSLVSAVYNLGGTIEKDKLGDVINEVFYWAYYTGRWSGESGTFESMFPASDDQYGSKYHFEVSGDQGKNLTNLIDHIKSGKGTAVVHVYAHYMVIVDYKEENGVEFLKVFDPAPGKIGSNRYYSVNRRNITNAAGDWIKVSDLQHDGGGAVDGSSSWENVEISNYWLVSPESAELNDLSVSCTGFTPNENEFLPFGLGYPVWGTVNSNYPLTKVVAELDGSEYATWNTTNSTTTSFAINPTEINKNLKFGSLSVGKHTITLTATDIHGRNQTFLERNFDVGLFSGNTEIENSNVFLKQETSTTCTLSAATMMVRRTAIIKGLANWESITESSMRKVAWLEGSGLYYNFTYTHNGVSIQVTAQTTFSGDYATKKAKLIELLQKHPQGIEIYNTSQPHAILLTKYDAYTDTFYCADPSGYAAKGQIPISQSSLKGSGQEGKINGISMYWYVSSPILMTSCSHSYSSTYSNDANNHWKVCTKCGSSASVEAHLYTNSCDTSCNTCGYTRSITHTYSNACDTSCNVCGTTRVTSHEYDNACDSSCNVCGETRSTNHKYSNACDDSCDVCGAVRTVPDHVYDHGCDTSCNNCGYSRPTSHTYDSNCDSDCNTCGAIRSVSHSYTSSYLSDDTTHWRQCSSCGYKGYIENHILGAPATETNPQRCLACEYVIQPALGHTHNFGDTYYSDEYQHWHQCADESCGAKTDIADHVFGQAEVTKEPTATEKGEKTYTCSVCGETKYEEIDVISGGIGNINDVEKPGNGEPSGVEVNPLGETEIITVVLAAVATSSVAVTCTVLIMNKKSAKIKKKRSDSERDEVDGDSESEE